MTATGSERGGASSVEAGVLALAVGLILALLLAGGRLVTAESAAHHAAQAAARMASLAREPENATVEATRSAQQTLDAEGLRCASTSVVLAIVEPEIAVRAEVTCSVTWSDLGVPGDTGSRDVTAVAVSEIDRMRER
jgi:Flp pilus assembly protein TadG